MHPSQTLSLAFSLCAFDANSCAEKIKVKVALQRDTLMLKYYLPAAIVGALSDCCFTQFQRKDELWKDNCLELFVGNESSAAYWEFNFSFTGDWNCYRFDDYRAGMRVEDTAELCAFRRAPVGHNMEFHICIRLPNGLASRPALCPTAVIVDAASKRPHFFAPSHQAEKPDFHLAKNRMVYI